MDDWFHCNSCFLQPDENNQNRQQFYLTSCGHIFCEHCGCFTESTSDRCKLCKTKCLSTKIGDEEFKKNKDIQEYFQKPIETGERLLNVLKFQKSHTSKLIKHHQLIITKYNRAKLYIKKLESELKNAKRALKNTPQNHNFTESCSSSVLEFDATPFKMIHAGVEEQNTRQVAKCNFCGRS
ncbi:Zinc finger, RING-type,Zinc finger, RING/FYVE/PHD-type [Cinara cedri]|uniref:Zinc finger, RING-type,Zinc finger, RING/FYVE/PHD-type n=1 Tax=Cinara cedri TaxID=506608 RepID=A0A5E4NN13_9HEMI|nr:Zinc finger, RING-type,Zinc finger, RING/FYVE/PHD-type [Cinara cedri]